MANKEGRRKREGVGREGRKEEREKLNGKTYLKICILRLYSRYLVYLMMDLFQIVIDSLSIYYIIHQIPFYIIYIHTHTHI